MKEAHSWRVLYRSAHVAEARSVATTIAAMEFDVRWNGAAIGDDLPAGPFFVEVRAEDHLDLLAVLDAIIEEQTAFDRRFEQRRHVRDAILFAGLILLTVLPIVLTILSHLAQFSARPRGAPDAIPDPPQRLSFAPAHA